jgi:glutamyl-tRNA synthetase
MQWLGLDWDEGPDRGGDFGPYRHRNGWKPIVPMRNFFLNKGLCLSGWRGRDLPGSARESRFLRRRRVRNITMQSETYKDIVLLKSDGFPTYNFAVVVDDYTMDITWSYVVKTTS